MNLSVELIFDASCPHVDAARRHVREALARVGLVAHWTEWDRAASASPPYVRHYASPTVLVGGRDVVGAGERVTGDGCRVYVDGSGALCGVLDVEVIVGALVGGARVTA